MMEVNAIGGSGGRTLTLNNCKKEKQRGMMRVYISQLVVSDYNKLPSFA
jgi:hypothetical protein